MRAPITALLGVDTIVNDRQRRARICLGALDRLRLTLLGAPRFPGIWSRILRRRRDDDSLRGGGCRRAGRQRGNLFDCAWAQTAAPDSSAKLRIADLTVRDMTDLSKSEDAHEHFHQFNVIVRMTAFPMNFVRRTSAFSS